MNYLLINRDTNVELADNYKDGFKRFKKQICRFGEFVSPISGDKKMILDKSFAQKMKHNFDSGKYGVVAVPLGHPKTDTELAELNRGELVDMDITDDGIVGTIEIKDDETVEKIEKRLIPDVSMGFSDNYQDKESGKFIGPLLKHVGLVVDPYIKGMTQFVPCGDMSATVLFSDSEINNQGKDETIMGTEVIKNDRDFPIEITYKNADGEEQTVVLEPGAELEVLKTEAEAIKEKISKAVKPETEDVDADADTDKSENDDGELSDQEKQEKELSDERAAFEAEKAEFNKQKAELEKKEAESRYEKLLSDGKILPAQKEAYLALSAAKEQEVHLSDDETKTVDTLLSELFEAMPDMRLLSEDGEEKGEDGDSEVELNDTDKQYIDRFGIDEEEYKKTKQELEEK